MKFSKKSADLYYYLQIDKTIVLFYRLSRKWKKKNLMWLKESACCVKLSKLILVYIKWKIEINKSFTKIILQYYKAKHELYL